MRTACYARFSSDLQRETSLDDQVRSCREYAERCGWEWQEAQVFTDAAMSGASIDGRAGLQALLSAAAASQRAFDVLLVDDSSRVARDLADALRVLQRLQFAGVRVVYISQSIDSTSEQAETLVAVHGLVDAQFLRGLTAKVRRGLVGQLERGFSPGMYPFGYRSVPVLDPSGALGPEGFPSRLGNRLEIAHSEAEAVRNIFSWYIDGLGVRAIVSKLQRLGVPGRKGRQWRFGVVNKLLRNERYTGRWVYGQVRYERQPGTRRRVARPQQRSEWRVVERPELRIISDEEWAAAQARLIAAATSYTRQAGTNLMRGKNAALHSPHLFSGFLRCGVCGRAVNVVTSGRGIARYGCSNHARNGNAACGNQLCVRAAVADAELLKGLQAELLHPATVAYITGRLTDALNALIDSRPDQRERLQREREATGAKLQNLIAAVEGGLGTPTIFQAIKDREGDIRALEGRLEGLSESFENRLAVLPTWVRQQLDDVASLLGDVPERAKQEFQRLGIQFTLQPVYEEGPRPFLRAEGSGEFEELAFSQYAPLSGTDTTRPRRAGSRSFIVDLPLIAPGRRFRLNSA